MTNATKAHLLAVLNAALILAMTFGLPLSQTQTAAIMVFANAVGVVYVGLTYKNSSKRIPAEGGNHASQ